MKQRKDGSKQGLTVLSKGGSGRIILVDFDLGVYILYYLIMIIPELSSTKKRPRPGGDKAVMSDSQAT